MAQAISTVAVTSSASRGPSSRLDLRFVRRATLLIVSLAVLLQLTLFFSTDNLVASALLLCGAFLGLYYSLDRQLLIEYPLSTLAILGYTISYFVMPPLGQLADFSSILHHLHNLIVVWIYGVVGLVAIIVAHYLYRVFSLCGIVRRSISNLFYRPLRFFEMPNVLQFWLMGFIGIAATFANIQMVHSTASTTPLASVLRSFRLLLYTPYFMIFPNLLDPRYRPRRRPLGLALIAYTILLIAVAAMTNSRGFMFTGLASLVVVYLYRVLTGTIAQPKLTWRSSIVLFVSIWLVSGPITNMAASMVVARKLRSSVSPRELAAATWGVYRSGAAVKSVENIENGSFHQYDEIYYGNIFLDRLGNVRYTDISIEAIRGAESLGELPYFRKIEFGRVVAVLPQPVIKAFHLDIDKKRLLSGSSEDFLYQLASGYPVGGFKTGFPLVILIATFGMMWPAYYVLLAITLFIFIDASVDLVSSFDQRGNRLTTCSVLNPIVAGTLFGATMVFTAYGLEDIAAYMNLIARDTLEIALTYAVAFMLTRSVSSLVLGWMWRAENAPRRGVRT